MSEYHVRRRNLLKTPGAGVVSVGASQQSLAGGTGDEEATAEQASEVLPEDTGVTEDDVGTDVSEFDLENPDINNISNMGNIFSNYQPRRTQRQSWITDSVILPQYYSVCTGRATTGMRLTKRASNEHARIKPGEVTR